MQQTGKILIIVGVIAVIAGIIIYFGGNKLHFLGRLPGDIRMERENFTGTGAFYFPVTTMILLSIIFIFMKKCLLFNK